MRKANELNSNHNNVLKLVKNELDIIFENTQIGIMIIKSDKISKINKFCLNLFGYDNDKLLKGRKKKILYPSNRDYFETELMISSILSHGQNYTGEHVLRRKDDSIFWASILCQNVNSKNSLDGVVWMIQDITSKKTYEQELERKVIQRTEELEVINNNLHKEIKCRKTIEDILTVREEQLLTLINSTPDIICFKDGEGRWLECNNFLKDIFSFESPDQWRGKSDLELAKYGPDNNKDFHFMCYDTDHKVWDKGELTHVEENFLVNNDLRTYDVIKVPIYKDDGDRKGLVVLGRDITDRKNSELKLIENEKKLSIILETLPIGVIVIDYNTKSIININPGACQLLNCKPEDIISKPCNEVICTKFSIKCPGFEHNVVKNEEIKTISDNRIFLKNSTLCEIGLNKYVIEVLTDITELKENQKRIRSSELKYRTLFNEAFDGIILVDFKTLKITDVNESALEFFKYKKEDFLEITIYHLLHCDNVEAIDQMIIKLKEDKNLYIEEVTGIDSLGNIIYFELQCNIIEVEDDEYIYIIIKDITEIKELEIELDLNRKRITKNLEKEIRLFQEELSQVSKTTIKNLEESANIIKNIRIGGDN